MSNSNKQYLNFTKEEIEKAGGYIKTDNDGQLDIFVPRSLLDDKLSKKDIKYSNNKQIGDDDDDDWKKKGL